MSAARRGKPRRKVVKCARRESRPAARASRDAQLHVLITNHQAVAALAAGTGTLADWQLVGAVLRLAQVIDAQTYGGGYAEQIGQAVQAHDACGSRPAAERSICYEPDELDHVNFAMKVHEQQIRKATFEELEAAMG